MLAGKLMFVFGLLAATGLKAQEIPANLLQREAGTATVQSVEQLGVEPTVTGTPYTATAVIETTQTLADGNRFVTRSTQRLFRDSKGRTRREEVIGKIGGVQTSETAVILIHDPVTQTDYTLDPVQHSVQASKPQIINLPSVGQLKPQEPRDSGGTTARRRRQVTREALGTQVMEGLTVEGSRITSTIPAGLLGNERPFSVSVETWYSPDLHLSVLRKRTDPRSGETVYRLTDIRREEPDPSLFQVPADYKTK